MQFAKLITARDITGTVKVTETAEIALTSKFQADMVAAREAKGWSQAELARRLGITQPAVSNIENGSASSSRYVMAISEELGIDPPIHLRDKAMREWLAAGGRLMRSNPALFQTTLAMIDAAAPDDGTVESSSDRDEKSSIPTK